MTIFSFFKPTQLTKDSIESPAITPEKQIFQTPKKSPSSDLFEGEISSASDLSSPPSSETSVKLQKRKRGLAEGGKRFRKKLDSWHDDDSELLPSLPQKPFLKEGIYVNEFYNDENNFNKRRFLPLPINEGDQILSEQKEFTVPFDIMFSYSKKMKLYKKIDQNIYVERRRRHDDFPAVCECTPQFLVDGALGCTDNCINRLCFIECNPLNCPCGERCSNETFQKKRQIKELAVFFAGEGRGFGLKTLVSIPKGKFIIEYKGEVISYELLDERVDTVYKEGGSIYFLDYNEGEVIDGGLKGNEARFVNHSCDPNCHIEKWHVDGEVRVGIFASRNIEAGEELTYDYNFHTFGDKRLECLCDSDKCRGLVGKSNEFKDINRKEKESTVSSNLSNSNAGSKDKNHASKKKGNYLMRDSVVGKRKQVEEDYEEIPLTKLRNNFDYEKSKIQYRKLKKPSAFLLRNTKWIRQRKAQLGKKKIYLILPKMSLRESLDNCVATFDDQKGN